jgi:hypothetical protein
MSTKSELLVLHRNATPRASPRDEARRASPSLTRAATAERRQKTGKRMIVAGFVIAVAGVVLYCLASFAGDLGAGMGDVLVHDAVPHARATLAVIGLGTLVWLVGSIKYLNGVMDADQGDDGSGFA